LEKLSGKKYTGSLPKPGSTGDTEQEKIDIAFRVIADHIRTLSFAIADGIQRGIPIAAMFSVEFCAELSATGVPWDFISHSFTNL
jgi:hypothetical protein